MLVSEYPRVLFHPNVWVISNFLYNFLHAVPTQELYNDLTNFSLAVFLVETQVLSEIPYFLASVKSRVCPLFCVLSSSL